MLLNFVFIIVHVVHKTLHSLKLERMLVMSHIGIYWSLSGLSFCHQDAFCSIWW